MDLSRITVKPRIRNNWEAIDLGFKMAKAWWPRLFLSWLIPAAIVFVTVSLLTPDNSWLAATVTWWLKPLWDRAPLFIASRKLFDEEITLKETFRKLPGLYSKDIFAWLLWRRFSLTRAFDMPVTVLESLKHEQRRKRLNTLHLHSANAATWLTIACVHLEMILWMGILGLFMLLVPEEVDIPLMDMIVDEDMIATLISNILSFLCMALVAPFYTLAGFALYINRRIELEAWDLEVRFRHLAQTQTQTRGKHDRLVAAVMIFICCFSIASFPEKSYADNRQNLSLEQSSTQIGEILEGPDFHNVVTSKGWRLKDFENAQENEDLPEWLIHFLEFLVDMLKSFASDGERDVEGGAWTFAALLEVLMWTGVIAITAYLVWRVLRYLELISPSRSGKASDAEIPPDILFGLDVRKDSIPKNLQEQAMALWRQGQHRDAAGLLYRSTLANLIHRFSFRFYDGFTEQECADIVSASDNRQLSDFVTSITDFWQQVAYAHRTPEDNIIQSLCARWTEVFDHEN